VTFGHGMTIPAIPTIQAHFGLSDFWAAQMVTSYAIGRLLGTPPAGIIVDKLGARVAMLLGPVLIAGAALSVAASPWYFLILIGLMIAGIGDSIWMIGREIAGVDLVKPEQRGRMMSGFMGTNSAGQALGPVLGGILAYNIDYRVVFVGYMAAGLAVLALSLLAPVQTRGGTHIPRRGGPSLPFWSPKRFQGIPNLIRQIDQPYRATYLVLVFATFTMMLYRMVLQSMLPLYVVTYRGYTEQQLGFLLGLQGIVVILMILPAGFITDKLGRKWATVPSTGIPAISFLLLPFTSSLVAMGALIVLLGFANGLSLGSVATSTYDIIPPSVRGRLQALRRTTSEVGGISGPTIGGVIAHLSNPGVAFLAAGPVLVIAAFALLFIAKETLGVRARDPAPSQQE
jgi:MFS family permease